jgi:hypothetical protein
MRNFRWADPIEAVRKSFPGSAGPKTNENSNTFWTIAQMAIHPY